MDKAELVTTVLQQRIGEIVSNYEAQIAIIRAELTKLSEQLQEQDSVVAEYVRLFEEKNQIEKASKETNENYEIENTKLRYKIKELEGIINEKNSKVIKEVKPKTSKKP